MKVNPKKKSRTCVLAKTFLVLQKSIEQKGFMDIFGTEQKSWTKL